MVHLTYLQLWLLLTLAELAALAARSLIRRGFAYYRARRARLAVDSYLAHPSANG